MNRIQPNLCFDTQAGKPARSYVDIFRESKFGRARHLQVTLRHVLRCR